MKPEPPPGPLRVGVDTGGTFTDFVVVDTSSGSVHTFKLPSTPANPALAVLEGIRRVAGGAPGASIRVVHGSTVATNALLERKGARTALVSTAGFRDVLAIGRQNRPRLYDLKPRLPAPLVPDTLRFEVSERVDAGGAVLQALEEDEPGSLVESLQRAGGVESVAVCLLFSFLYPDHERRLGEHLRAAGYRVSLSHEILPEYREYERMSTTVVNAYVSPIFDRYIAELEGELGRGLGHGKPIPLAVMQSNGGTISPARARREAVRCILSGPAGGVMAAHNLPGAPPGTGLMTIDMGGTSTDVSLLPGRPQLTTEAEIGGMPIRVPVLDIHTIGAGGGSIAYLDPGGGLRVGPQSAGADPGPACYGLSRDDPPLPTVTDANLVLGRLLPDRFLGGAMPLHPDRARAAIRPLADTLGLDLMETASGIVRIANAHMARALRVISVERGHDPEGFTLVSFGGAGGLHAAALAGELGIPRVLVPRHASTLSALGMLQADVVKDYTRTVMLPGSSPLSDLELEIAALESRARADLLAEGLVEEVMAFEPGLDVRFRGQSYELGIPFSANWHAAFETLYRETYGFLPAAEAIEIVNVRLQARGAVPRPAFTSALPAGPDPGSARLDDRQVWFDGSLHPIPVFAGEALSPGNIVPGPALIARSDTTLWLPEGCDGIVDAYGNTMITAGKQARRQVDRPTGNGVDAASLRCP